jgi:hypothetical protein
MVNSPKTTSVRRPAAISVRLARSQGCDRAVGNTAAWPGAGHTRTLCRVSRRYAAIDTGTERDRGARPEPCCGAYGASSPLCLGNHSPGAVGGRVTWQLACSATSHTVANTGRPQNHARSRRAWWAWQLQGSQSANTCQACVCLGGWAAPPLIGTRMPRSVALHVAAKKETTTNPK